MGINKIKTYLLRVSVIQQCQYRCPYCLPDLSFIKIKKNNWMTLEDYDIASKSFNLFNIRKVRFTGGEPLLRSDICEIINIFNRNIPKAKLAITTNAYFPEKRINQMKNSGISAVNIHVDSLNQAKYYKITGKKSKPTIC